MFMCVCMCVCASYQGKNSFFFFTFHCYNILQNDKYSDIYFNVCHIILRSSINNLILLFFSLAFYCWRFYSTAYVAGAAFKSNINNDDEMIWWWKKLCERWTFVLCLPRTSEIWHQKRDQKQGKEKTVHICR